MYVGYDIISTIEDKVLFNKDNDIFINCVLMCEVLVCIEMVM